MKKIFVGNLPWKITEDDLKKHFEKYGKVISAKIVIDSDTKKSKGFGFVEMEEAEAAENAIRELNGVVLLDRALRISLAQERGEQRPPRDRDNSYGGGSRSGGYGQGRRSTM